MASPPRFSHPPHTNVGARYDLFVRSHMTFEKTFSLFFSSGTDISHLPHIGRTHKANTSTSSTAASSFKKRTPPPPPPPPLHITHAGRRRRSPVLSRPRLRHGSAAAVPGGILDDDPSGVRPWLCQLSSITKHRCPPRRRRLYLQPNPKHAHEGLRPHVHQPRRPLRGQPLHPLQLHPQHQLQLPTELLRGVHAGEHPGHVRRELHHRARGSLYGPPLRPHHLQGLSARGARPSSHAGLLRCPPAHPGGGRVGWPPPRSQLSRKGVPPPPGWHGNGWHALWQGDEAAVPPPSGPEWRSGPDSVSLHHGQYLLSRRLRHLSVSLPSPKPIRLPRTARRVRRGRRWKAGAGESAPLRSSHKC